MKHEINLVNYDGKPVILEVREGAALPLKEENKVSISGNIDAISRYLQTRKLSIEMQMCSHIVIDREDKSITLNLNASNFYGGVVTGKLAYSKAFTVFEINTGKEYTTFELADFIKMNRSAFEKPTEAVKLIKELNNFKAKVQSEVEKLDDKRGNRTDFQRQAVDSNIPEKFNLLLPIFKGQQKRPIEVEVNINPSSLNCTLISPQAKEIIDTVTDDIINTELELIKDNAPEIVIIEK